MLKHNSKKVLDIIASQKKRNATQAYQEVHPNASPESARVLASQLLAKPEAQIYLKEHIDKAQQTIVELMTTSEKDDIRLRSAQDVMDRSHGKAVQQVQQNTSGVTINIDLASSLPLTDETDQPATN